MKTGEIYLARFPFGDKAGMKTRPVYFLTGRIGLVPEYIVAYISSTIPSVMLASDLLLDPAHPAYASIGLKVPSVLRLHKIATIHRSSILRILGQVSAQTVKDIEDRLRVLLHL